MLKSKYFLGVAQEQQGHKAEAMETYQSALQDIETAPKELAVTSGYRSGAERLLARACSLAMPQSTISTIKQANLALGMFRSWSSNSQSSSSRDLSTASDGAIPRRRLWSQYYRLLSLILASGLSYSDSPGTPLTLNNGAITSGARAKQRAEFKRAETAYETLILQDTKFPTAQQSNVEVENWTNQVMSNWRVFCGSAWTEDDVGEGGKDAVGRGVLDVRKSTVSRI